MSINKFLNTLESSLNGKPEMSEKAGNQKKNLLSAGLEPATTGLKVLRSTDWATKAC